MQNYKSIYVVTFLLWVMSLPLANAQRPLADYIEVMQKGEDPIDYVFRLFETSDIVVLGERDHRDVTQYEFINKLIADPRFANRIGYVYTEVGVTNMTRRANNLIKGKYSSWEEYKKARLDYLRDEDYSFCWEKTNRSIFIDSLYSTNSRLADGKKITLGLTDVAFDWHKQITPYKYKKWYNKINYNGVRDKMMAKNFIRLYRLQKPIGGRRKALLITNEPHAVNDPHMRNEGFWIKRKFGDGRVKIVCFNWYDVDGDYKLIDDGKWDAAFELTECKPVGFDIQNTAFGQTMYKLFDANGEKSWQNYADGIIYYKPFYEFIGSMGIDGFVADSCRAEQQRRRNLLKKADIIQNSNLESVKYYFNTVRTFPLTDEKKLRGQMEEQICKYKEQ